MDVKQSGFFGVVVPFAIGGVSGAVATSVIQPIDTFKVQIQVLLKKLGERMLRFYLFQIFSYGFTIKMGYQSFIED